MKTLHAHPYAQLQSVAERWASIDAALGAGEPWLLVHTFAHLKHTRGAMRLHGRRLMGHILGLIESQNAVGQASSQLWYDSATGPKTLVTWRDQTVQLGVSYARDACLIGLWATPNAQLHFGLDITDVHALQDWSASEFTDVAKMYLSQHAQQKIHLAPELLRAQIFAQEWAAFEAVSKAHKKQGIVENLPYAPEQDAWVIENLPTGLVGCVAVARVND